VEIEVEGLPPFKPATSRSPQIGPFGLHIHEHGHCGEGGGKEPFALAGGHYNPDHQPHGNHAGDLPVLFSNNGAAQMSVYTSRFKPEQVIGRSIVIHQSPDDFRTQPSGNSGLRIACGEILRYRPLRR
jgi:Cu-Zn family superoxide dismutase